MRKPAQQMLSRTLITGSGGTLGGYIPFGIPMNSAALDITDLVRVRQVFAEHKPAVILHLAALADIAACERNPDLAYRTNAIGTYNLALAAREIGAKLVFVSTSIIFDGSKTEPYDEEDIPNPSTTYGHSKYLGELAVQGLLEDYLIVRTCWVFGGGQNDRKFVGNIIRQLGQPRIEVMEGTHGSPTYAKDFVEALTNRIENDERGIFHIANQGAPTRVEMAHEIVRLMGAQTEITETDAAVLEARFPGAVTRGNESITSSKIILRPWQEALKEYLEVEWKSG